MVSAGMYDASGRWMVEVGIPAKSGVAGGLIGTLPGQLGIASLSPRLDKQGNSVRGVLAFERMSEDLNLHVMEADVLGGTVVRFVRREGDTVLMHLQGVIRFGGFCRQIYDLLDDDGLCYFQLAGLRKYWQYEDLIWGLFMNKYIFPGADASCSLGWVINQVEAAGFEVKNIDVLGVHYSATIWRWYRNWISNKDKVIEVYGERGLVVEVDGMGEIDAVTHRIFKELDGLGDEGR